ncbi:DUF1345 domain-containing protein [Citricoccus nitrophenolicus]|uniref:DUF1345 domain-containing protein n=1 Tax=Citricoccus nitrophenolicus TaxID=863575 RepID=A0ABV0IM28_9MICC
MRSSPSARPRPARRNWWQRCMDSDDGRLWVALLPAFPVAYAITFPALYLWGQAEERVRAPDSAAAALLFMMVFWLLYSLAYALLTLHRYRRLASARLHEDLRTVSRGSTGRFLGWWRMGSTLSWSAQLAVLALTMVVAVMLIPEARALLALRILGVLAVAASWVLLVLSQTLAYARTNAQVGGIEFAGTPDPSWGDYLSLAIFVSAMLGQGDATLCGRRVRTLMRNHVLVSFGFNSMVVATLATLLLA